MVLYGFILINIDLLVSLHLDRIDNIPLGTTYVSGLSPAAVSMEQMILVISSNDSLDLVVPLNPSQAISAGQPIGGTHPPTIFVLNMTFQYFKYR